MLSTLKAAFSRFSAITFTKSFFATRSVKQSVPQKLTLEKFKAEINVSKVPPKIFQLALILYAPMLLGTVCIIHFLFCWPLTSKKKYQ